ncbi:hypothetical protein SESBI_19812 [Sesbania bispinosa]|nr:hypothetical protein SESBI_19812 [Sesbania bispinosa]
MPVVLAVANRETPVPLSSPSSPSRDCLRSPSSPSSPSRPCRRPPSPSVCGRCAVASMPGPGCAAAASVPAPFYNCDAAVASMPAPCCNCSIAINSTAVAAVPPSVTFCCSDPNIVVWVLNFDVELVSLLVIGLHVQLIESGEKERLMELLREMLVDCGWKNEMKALYRG